MIKVLIATENENKVRELQEILSQTCVSQKVNFVTLKDYPGFNAPEESGRTLRENAIIKAKAAALYTGLPTLADDTGLEVDALNGAPGVYSARYAGPAKDPSENNRKLLDLLDGLFLGQRGARFKTVACYASPEGKVMTEEGVLDGFIGFGYRGENGFGYDPVFIVKGKGKTLAEMSAQEKNALSHRRKAFEKIIEKVLH